MVGERRQHHRFEGSSEVLAVLKPYPIKLGQIANISEGGLAFQYLSENEVEHKYLELDIFISANGQQYNDFPVSAVRDFRVSNQFEKLTPKRQICIKFGELSKEQTQLLKSFIDRHTA